LLKVRIFSLFSAQPSIRLIESADEILDYPIVEVESLGDDLFMLRERYDGSSFILVYPNDRPISLTPEIPSTEDRHHIATCNKMQCLYLSTVNYQTQKLSIGKITKNAFVSSPWIQKDQKAVTLRHLNVSFAGNVLLSWYSSDIGRCIVSIYNSSALQIQEIAEPFDIPYIEIPYIDRRLQKTDGRIVYLGAESRTEVKTGLEIDGSGGVLQKFNCRHRLEQYALDKFDRLIVWENNGHVNFLDSYLNELRSSVGQPFELSPYYMHYIHYDDVRHKLSCLTRYDAEDECTRLTI